MSFPEKGDLDDLFDFFRKNKLDVEWVKQQVYGKSTIPEKFPVQYVRDFEIVMYEITQRISRVGETPIN